MARLVFELAVPDGVTVELGALRFAAERFAGEHATACGWPYRLEDAADGAPADTIVARYRFLDHEAVVIARGPRDRVLALLASARPDWRGEDVIALAELWEPA